ncbi:BppU family phage baseplate upper protein [Tetragenococcus halophilus]|uniref:BppU family phage baseplate upper protein n=1 Tax=Tetragenococcus halophilus TaxID=51669 RepID=UPI002A980070|nr:hypothetical protein TEHSL10_19030 [Tetragenococcus halophilus]
MPVLKKGEIKVRATAYGTEVKSTGYVFYSYDKKASALFFQFRNQNGETTDIANAKIRLLLIKNDDEEKEFIPSQEDFEIISKPGGKAKFVLPEMLLAYQGKVTGYIYLDFEDGSQTDEGQFTFRIRRSMITHVLPAMGDKYVRDFEDITERVKQAEDKAKKDMQNSVDQVNKDYEAWKAEQKKENEDFQNEYKQHWQNFKNTQNKNHTDFEDDFKKWKETQGNKQKQFESDFQSWKDTQVNKQTDFEDSTNEQLKGITEDVNNAEDKVADLEKNLDVEQKNYFSVTAWENNASTDVVDNNLLAVKLKLEGNTQYTLSTNIPMHDESSDKNSVFFATGNVGRVYSHINGVAIDNPRTITTHDDGAVIIVIRDKDITSGDWWVMLNKGSTAYDWTPNTDDLATKQETDKKLADKADKTDLAGKVGYAEREFITPEKAFENLHQEDTKSNRSTWLQIVLQGSIGYIFGTVKSAVDLEAGFDLTVCKLPNKYKILTTLTTSFVGDFGKSGILKILNSEDYKNPNKVNIYNFKDVDGEIPAPTGERFDLFGVFLIDPK